MLLTAAAFWLVMNRVLPPDTAENPAEGSGAFKFIVKRLIDSFNLPTGVAEYYEWMNLPTHNDDILGVIALVGTAQRTIVGQMPKLRRMIDHGHPCLAQSHGPRPEPPGARV